MKDNNFLPCVKVASEVIPESLFSKFDLEQGKSEGFDSCDRVGNLTQIGFKSLIFQSVTLNLMDDLEKTLGHFFYTILSQALYILS